MYHLGNLALLGVRHQVAMVTGQYANVCPVGPVVTPWCRSVPAEWPPMNMMSRGASLTGADLATSPSEAIPGERRAGLPSRQ